MEHGFIGILFIVVALIFIFGGRKRLEDLGAGFGGFMREFNKARQDATVSTEEKKAASKNKQPVKKAAVRKKR
jgi:Sec-independent protein translocase protein TatA